MFANIPYKKVFFIGIGGVGMSGLAKILNANGYKVEGSDKSKSKIVEDLEKEGIKVYLGEHKAERIKEDIELVVYSNAVPEDNPELVEARRKNIPIMVRAELLGKISQNYFSIGVSGTHGKTTTTSLISQILLDAGMDPTISNGGVLPSIQSNARVGKSKYFVYEACEAFASFLYTQPNISVVTNIDNDHIEEFFKTMENLKIAFTKFMAQTKDLVVINGDDQPTLEALETAGVQNYIKYGMSKNNDVKILGYELREHNSVFRLEYFGKDIGEFLISIPGRHNVYNATAAITVALQLGVPLEVIKFSLQKFKNAERRFQIKFSDENIVIIDDYGHHPTEIRATLETAKMLGRKVIAIFQPHLYSRTSYLYKDFAEALKIADIVVLAEIYPAREKPIEGVSSKLIVEELEKRGHTHVFYIPKSLEDIVNFVYGNILRGGEVVVVLGAGDITKVSDMLVSLVTSPTSK